MRPDFVNTMIYDDGRLAKFAAAAVGAAVGAGAAVGPGAAVGAGAGVAKEVGEGGVTLESYASLVSELRVGRERGYLLRR